MSDNLHWVFIGVVAGVFALSYLARRFPRVYWLQRFRFQRPYDPHRDRHLDTAWMPSSGRRRPNEPLRETYGEVREAVRDVIAGFPQVSKERRQQLRRRSNVVAGIQLILLGIALPFGYHILSVMTFFSSVSMIENVVLIAAGAACVAFGIAVIWRRNMDQEP